MNIKVLSQKKAEQLSKTITVPVCVISITSPDESDAVFDQTNPNIKKIFRMKFYDVDSEPAGLPKASPEDMAGLKQFIDAIPEDIDTLVIHCGAGISRSAGCAAAIAEYLNIPHDIWGNKRYTPNRHVYKTTMAELTGETKSASYFEQIFSKGDES